MTIDCISTLSDEKLDELAKEFDKISKERQLSLALLQIGIFVNTEIVNRVYKRMRETYNA